MRAKEFGHRLKEALDGKGLSKLQFSRELQARRFARSVTGEPPLRKVDRPALYAFLQGRDYPPLDTLSEMAKILGVRLGWLAEGEEPVERELDEYPSPIWIVDGHRGSWKRPSVEKRAEARKVFEDIFFSRSKGYYEAEYPVRLAFQELLGRRLARRRDRGDRGPADPAYRASTARSLYLKCFLDVVDDLLPGTEFSSEAFTTAFLARLGGWLEDERG